MARFAAGFALASALWAGVLGYLVVAGGWGPPDPEEEVAIEVAAVDAPSTDEPLTKRRTGRRRTRSGATSTGDDREAPRGEATTGDDLREDEARTIDMEGGGGEQQLTGGQIETAFDGAMGRIRRCLVLAAGDEPVRGRLTFGLRVAGSGRVTAVNLSGPAAVTTGDSGDCLREQVRGISFPTFNGPEMVVRYPITLE